MLLFDYGDNGLTSSDYFIIVLITSFVVDEIKQVIVAFLRGQLKSYASDWWNTLDWLFNISYTLGMLLRAGYGSGFQNTSKCLLLLAFMILCIRILNICCMTEFLGPKLIIIRKMIKQTVAFMIIMTVIVVWYSVSFHALVYPNSEFSWREIEKILSNGYWVLFGELNLDDEKVTVQNCTNTINGTADDNDNLQQSATQLGEDLTPYLKALYGLIAVVLLLNLLIALYRKIDLEDFDAIATMNKIADSLKDLKEKKQMRELDSKRADRRNHETMNKLEKIEDSLKDMQEMKQMLDIETRAKPNRETVDHSDEGKE
ncbi:TRPM2 [Mytilus edulis]|uniref:TRPM2 n=1 Tax=Mytilus edulis TaxID=6550 RepID=A0A8S3Q4I9_MYTED|nr:TRPM2 [Mytilus edulis]